MDIVDSTTRSRMMGQIRSRDTKPEMAVRRFLHANGFRYRLHDRKLPGRPDVVLPKYRTAIFVHGCFWHQHDGCPMAYTPSTHREKWVEKFASNKARDKRALETLKQMDWNVIVVWECGLRKLSPNAVLSWLPNEIRQGKRSYIEWPSSEHA